MGYKPEPPDPQDEFGPCRFRTEDFSGEGFRDPADVMAHETVELGNSDCVEYMIYHYLCEGTPLMEKAWAIWNATESDNAGSLSFNNVKEFFNECLDEVRVVTGKTITFGVWLARRDVVRDFYGHGAGEIVIDEYDTSGAAILDNLGYDGRLYGFEAPILPVRSDIAKLQKEA